MRCFLCFIMFANKHQKRNVVCSVFEMAFKKCFRYMFYLHNQYGKFLLRYFCVFVKEFQSFTDLDFHSEVWCLKSI